jgi:hypothetical protein
MLAIYRGHVVCITSISYKVTYLPCVTAERRRQLKLSFTPGNFTIGGSGGMTSYQPPV